MTPSLRFDFDDADDNDELADSRRASAPELLNRRAKSPTSRKRASRNRSNDVAKRGIHQRRKKRVSW